MTLKKTFIFLGKSIEKVSVTDQMQKWHHPPKNLNECELQVDWDDMKGYNKPEFDSITFSKYEQDRMINIHINRGNFNDLTKNRNINPKAYLNDHNYFDEFEEMFINAVNKTLTKEKIIEIEGKTVSQHKNNLWTTLRKSRITASIAAEVVKNMKRYKSCLNVTKKILNPPKLDHIPAIANGRKGEEKAFELYRKITNIPIRKCGIFIDEDRCYLAASPDGICEAKQCVIEIKCPYTAVDSKELKYLNNGKLKTNHNYYTQIQLQLHVTKMKMCHFIVYSMKSGFIHIETIFYDTNFVEDVLTYIDKFYKEIFIHEYALVKLSD